MRTVPAPLLATIAKPAFRLATLVHLEREDGTLIAMTTWDRPLDVNLGLASGVISVVYSPADMEGVTAFSAQINAAIDDSELSVLLENGEFIADDVRKGLFARATATVAYVDPDDLDNPWVHRVYDVGQARIEGARLKLELMGPEKRLETPIGRPLTKTCPWNFGDPDTCRATKVTGDGVVNTITDPFRSFRATLDYLSGATQNDYFGEGLLEWTSGANAGQKRRIRSDDGAGFLVLHIPMLDAILVGDEFTATVGCRKRLAEDCRDKHDNVPNFGGFPHLAPENVTATASRTGQSE